MVGRVGIEPTTVGLKGHCSTTELPTREAQSTGPWLPAEVSLRTRRQKARENPVGCASLPCVCRFAGIRQAHILRGLASHTPSAALTLGPAPGRASPRLGHSCCLPRAPAQSPAHVVRAHIRSRAASVYCTCLRHPPATCLAKPGCMRSHVARFVCSCLSATQ